MCVCDFRWIVTKNMTRHTRTLHSTIVEIKWPLSVLKLLDKSQLILHANVTASLNTKFCRPSKIIFSHISKFQFVYVFRFFADRPQYGGVHKDFQRLEVQTRFVASESNFPPQQTFVPDPAWSVVVAIQRHRYLGKTFSENQCYFPLSVSSLLKLHKWQYNGKTNAHLLILALQNTWWILLKFSIV